jgi:hypothetical protein
METLLITLSVVVGVIVWSYVTYQSGYIAGARNRRQIEDAVRNSGNAAKVGAHTD